VRRDVRARGNSRRKNAARALVWKSLHWWRQNAATHGGLAPRRAALGDVATRARTTASDRTHYRALL